MQKQDHSELIDQLIKDHSYGLEHLEYEIEDKHITDQQLILKRDFLRAIKDRNQDISLSMVNDYHTSAPILYMFQSYLDHALNKQMAFFQNRFDQMKTPRVKGTIL